MNNEHLSTEGRKSGAEARLERRGKKKKRYNEFWQLFGSAVREKK